jgi:hypothetical protein
VFRIAPCCIFIEWVAVSLLGGIWRSSQSHCRDREGPAFNMEWKRASSTAFPKPLVAERKTRGSLEQ